MPDLSMFKNILVAVDLSAGDRFVGEQLSAPTQEAIRQAEWVAQSGQAKVHFLYVLPPQADQLSHDRQVLMVHGDQHKSVKQHAEEVLANVAALTSQKSIATSSKVVFGKSWVELIREAIRGDADLVIAGTRQQGPFRAMLFGSTGIKLLRSCPCSVWITKPQPTEEPVDSILVAHDLTAVGDRALELGAMFAKGRGSELHVIHAVERSKSAWKDCFSADQARDRIAEQLESLGCHNSKVKVSVVDGAPEDSILAYVNDHDIQLVVMGTVARSGVARMFVGNTAEKLLPFLPCSVLAIKPQGFESAVLLPSDELEDGLL